MPPPRSKKREIPHTQTIHNDLSLSRSTTWPTASSWGKQSRAFCFKGPEERKAFAQLCGKHPTTPLLADPEGVGSLEIRVTFSMKGLKKAQRFSMAPSSAPRFLRTPPWGGGGAKPVSHFRRKGKKNSHSTPSDLRGGG